MLRLLILFLKVVKPRRVRFGNWAKLETIAKQLNKVIDSDITKFPKLVIEYTSITLFIPVRILEKLPWTSTLALYSLARTTNSLTKIPLLTSKDKDKEVPWDYVGRDWNYYSHLLAKEYGWELQYIAGLDVDVALAHIQEILVDDQMNREFLWSMSEVAYPYNATTKKSNFSPLPRPYFMLEATKPIKLFKVPRTTMPMGIINDRSGMQAYLEKEKSKEIDVARNN